MSLTSLRTPLLSAAFTIAAAAPAIAQVTLQPGELVIGSRAYGAVIGPLRASGELSPLITGADISQSDLPVRGVGPTLASAQLHLIAMPGSPTRLIASPGGNLPRGHYLIDLATGDRTRLPGTDAAIWATGGDMVALDDDQFLAVADDFSAGSLGDGKIIRYRLSTGESTLITGVARGNGFVMYRPRAIAVLNPSAVLVQEFGVTGGNTLPGSLLYRINLVTGEREVLSSIAPEVAMRYTATDGTRSAAPASVPERGSGPTFFRGNRGVAVVAGRIFVAGTADSSFVGGIIEVDPVTGDRSLFGGAALVGGVLTTIPFGPGSDPYIADAPTALQPYTSHSFVMTDTFGANRVWEVDIITRRVRILADIDPQVVPAFRTMVQCTGLAVVPCIAGAPTPGFSAAVQPAAAIACPTGVAAFAVSATSAGPFTFRWQWKSPVFGPGGGAAWSDVVEGANTDGAGVPRFAATGSAAQTLTVQRSASPPQPLADFAGFTVRAVVTNVCGSVMTTDATLTLCRADFNCSGGQPTIQDIFDFLAAYFAGDAAADINGVGGVGIQDVFDYLALYFIAC